ncbi:3-hydroxyacyl-CoA dehydrogenase NAD-binding domain-containing protein [Trinickia sp. NRRL B-1857]|uniref:3-hydroxyacyl-CoA dehydrogenase family protein n=1 Tax=Trinickia sp. NRRL B-1857 TaxID=3162879 RepID=UPI003D29B868
MDSLKIGVVGAGVIGRSIAEAVLGAGLAVTLVDVNKETLVTSRELIETSLKAARLFDTRNPSLHGTDEILSKLIVTHDYTNLVDADIVIESVTEQWEAKRHAYALLERVCKASCLYIANPSVFPIAKIAALTGRADRVVGVHFMNPVPMKKTVEAIVNSTVSAQSSQRLFYFLDRIGKKAIVVRDAPGFVSNRIMMPVVNDAARLVEDEIASARDVDAVFRECFAHKMGPLEMADLIGLDTVLYSLQRLQEELSDDRYRPCRTLVEKVESGKLGRKTGEGFFVYR